LATFLLFSDNTREGFKAWGRFLKKKPAFVSQGQALQKIRALEREDNAPADYRLKNLVKLTRSDKIKPVF
jgi:hypothetical protein